MNLPTILLISLFNLLFQLSWGQESTKDSCGITIGTWFEPECHWDTCTGPRSWIVTYDEACHFVNIVYKVYNPPKTKLIYRSNKIWDGKLKEPLLYHKAGYYPYEILFYTSDKKYIKKEGKIHLHIW